MMRIRQGTAWWVGLLKLRGELMALRDCKNLTSLFRDRLLSMVRAWV